MKKRKLTVIGDAFVPGRSMIRLAGKWLTVAGFRPNEKVSVNVQHGRIIITKGTE